MTEAEFREIAFELLGYPKDQTVAGMAAKDLPKLQDIEQTLRSVRDEALEEAAKIIDNPKIYYATNDNWHGFKWSTETEARILEGVKKIVDQIRALKKEPEKGR